MGVYGFYLGEADIKEEVLHLVYSYFIIKNDIIFHEWYSDISVIFAFFPCSREPDHILSCWDYIHNQVKEWTSNIQYIHFW